MEFVERKRLLFFGLPWTFTKYTVTEEVVNIKAGLLKTIEDDCYLYKVTDVKLETSLIERMFKLGTVVCFTGDTTHQTLRLIHIKNAHAIKDFILEQSEAQRLKRRTLNTQSLNAVTIDEIDEINE
ncbi:MAG: PH domain-containing protein [Lachnospiraceae bacterium]|nr:PH domain-containing protein [Lachnospiraceae bacterium]